MTDDMDEEEAENFQQLVAYLRQEVAEMNSDLEVMQTELENLRKENQQHFPEVAESFISAIHKNSQLGNALEEYLRPVITAIQRHESATVANELGQLGEENEPEANDQSLTVLSDQLESLNISTNFPSPKKSELMTSLDILIEHDEIMLLKFQEIKEKCETDHKKCNVVKSVGTPMAATGTVMSMIGLAAALPTAGLSLWLTWGGLAVASAGSLTNIRADRTKRKHQNLSKTSLEILCANRRFLQEEYQSKLEIFNQTVDSVISTGAMTDESEAQRLVFVLTELGGVSLLSVSRYLNKMRNIRAQMEGRCVLNKISEFRDVSGGKGDVLLGMGRGMAKAVGSELGGVTRILGRESLKVTGEVGAKMLKNVSVGIGIFFIALDATILYRSWTSKAEFVDAIEEKMKAIDEELGALWGEKIMLDSYSVLNRSELAGSIERGANQRIF